MSSKQSTADFIVDQLSHAGVISSKKMFGEYAIYCDGKLPALVADDQLFVKPTEAGRRFIGSSVEAPPYFGVKFCFLIFGDRWDDSDWLCELICITMCELPVPIPKKKKK